MLTHVCTYTPTPSHANTFTRKLPHTRAPSHTNALTGEDQKNGCCIFRECEPCGCKSTVPHFSSNTYVHELGPFSEFLSSSRPSSTQAMRDKQVRLLQRRLEKRDLEIFHLRRCHNGIDMISCSLSLSRARSLC